MYIDVAVSRAQARKEAVFTRPVLQFHGQPKLRGAWLERAGSLEDDFNHFNGVHPICIALDVTYTASGASFHRQRPPLWSPEEQRQEETFRRLSSVHRTRT